MLEKLARRSRPVRRQWRKQAYRAACVSQWAGRNGFPLVLGGVDAILDMIDTRIDKFVMWLLEAPEDFRVVVLAFETQVKSRWRETLRVKMSVFFAAVFHWLIR